MSQGPSTFGSMITSSLAPAAGTISRMSSSPQGEFRALMRVQRPVWPKPCAFAMAMKPLRAAIFASEVRPRPRMGGILVRNVTKPHIDCGEQLRQPRAHLLVVRRHEVNHALE